MNKTKIVRDGALVVLALGTAYGLGIISCVWWELKALAEVSKNKKEETYL